jgi:thiamine-phosphate pyrophosphorylase
MTPQNCAPFVAAGADFIAAITAIWEHPKGAAAAVKEFNQAIKAALKNARVG